MNRKFFTANSLKALLAMSCLTLSLGMAFAANPTILNTIPVGTKPAGIAVNETTNRVYVSSDATNRLYVIDGVTESVIAVVPVGAAPQGVAVDETNNRIYVVNVNGPTVSVINGSTNTVIATIPGLAYKPRFIAVNPLTNTLYVSNEGNQTGTTVSVIDGNTLTVTGTITVPICPDDIAIDLSTNRLYVANFVSNKVTVIDGYTNAVVTTISVGAGPVDLDLNAATGLLYVGNQIGNSVSVIDISTNSVVATIPAGNGPRGVAVNSTTNEVFVGNFNGNTLNYINGNTNTLVATLPAGINPVDMAMNETTGSLYVANFFGNSVSVFGKALTVTSIDAKPGSEINPVNLKSKGTIPVAILTTSVADGYAQDFDAVTVDPMTVRFGAGQASESHGIGHLEDVDGDGDFDLMLHFKIQESGIQCGDTLVSLTGQTYGGDPIVGTNPITVNCD